MQRANGNPSARAPRIAIVTTGLGRGGTEMHLLQVLPRLIERGIAVRLYVLRRGGSLEEEFARSGIMVQGCRATGGRLSVALRSAIGLARFLRAWRPDAVHYFLPEPYLLGAALSPFVHAPLRLMSRRSLALYQTKYPMVRWIERIAHRRTAALLGNSRAVIAELRRETYDHRKIGLIANGTRMPEAVPDDERTALKRTLDLPAHGFIMIVVANLIPYKGHADLLSALADVKDRLPVDWRLLVVGRDGGILADLRRQTEQSGIARHILWLGERRDVPRLLRIADLAVLASHEEGSPNSLIEAMMCGLPVVATAVGGSAEIVVTGEGETGELVAAKDPRALGAAIARVAADPERRAAMARRGRARAMAEFSLERCTERYLALYENLDLIATRPVQEVLDGHRGA